MSHVPPPKKYNVPSSNLDDLIAFSQDPNNAMGEIRLLRYYVVVCIVNPEFTSIDHQLVCKAFTDSDDALQFFIMHKDWAWYIDSYQKQVYVSPDHPLYEIAEKVTPKRGCLKDIR